MPSKSIFCRECGKPTTLDENGRCGNTGCRVYAPSPSEIRRMCEAAKARRPVINPHITTRPGRLREYVNCGGVFREVTR